MKKLLTIPLCIICFIALGQRRSNNYPSRAYVQQQYNHLQQQYNEDYQRQIQYWQQNYYRPVQPSPRNYKVKADWGDVYNVAVGGAGYVVTEIASTAVRNRYQNRGYQTYSYPLPYEIPTPRGSKVGNVLNALQAGWSAITSSKPAY